MHLFLLCVLLTEKVFDLQQSTNYSAISTRLIILSIVLTICIMGATDF